MRARALPHLLMLLDHPLQPLGHRTDDAAAIRGPPWPTAPGAGAVGCQQSGLLARVLLTATVAVGRVIAHEQPEKAQTGRGRANAERTAAVRTVDDPGIVSGAAALGAAWFGYCHCTSVNPVGAVWLVVSVLCFKFISFARVAFC